MTTLLVILLVIVLLFLLSPYLLRWGMRMLSRRLSRLMEEQDGSAAATGDSDPKVRKRRERAKRDVEKIFGADEGAYVDFEEEKR